MAFLYTCSIILCSCFRPSTAMFGSLLKKKTPKLELRDCAPYVSRVLEDTIPSGFKLKAQQGG